VGLATDGERLWVSDWATGIVWQVAFEGATALPAVPVASELANPEGLAFDGEGGLLVVETGAGRLSRIDLATGAVEEIATGLAVGLAAFPGIPPSYVHERRDGGRCRGHLRDRGRGERGVQDHAPVTRGAVTAAAWVLTSWPHRPRSHASKGDPNETSPSHPHRAGLLLACSWSAART
jgi:sugar lactone lactonase YvrE